MDNKSSTPKSHLQQHQQREQAAEQEVANQAQTHREFGSVEELLRYDASQTPPPPAIAEKLKTSLGENELSESRQSWWRRLFGRRSPDS
jgi:hypothetical protein